MASNQLGESTSPMTGQITDASTCANGSSRVLFGDKLPKELREMIHSNSLALCPGIQPPALLEAVNKATRVELLEIYRRINYVVRKENHDRFRKVPIHKFLLIRHLTLIYEGKDEDAWLGFHTDKSMLMNKFKTLTIDLSNYDGAPFTLLGTMFSWITNLSSLVMASSEGIVKFTFVFARPCTRAEDAIRREINVKFGFEPKIEPDLSSGRNLHVLVWEASKHYLKARAKSLYGTA